MGIKVQERGRYAGVSLRRITASILSFFFGLYLALYLFKSSRMYSGSCHVHTHEDKGASYEVEVKERGR